MYVLRSRRHGIETFLELACRDDERQAPFEKIVVNPSDFIEADYLPTGISIKDPCSMRLDSLIQFFKHVSQRETSHGIPNGFRFKAISSSRKKGSLLLANYKHDGNDMDQENTMENNRCNHRRHRKQGGNPTILSQDISEE